MKARNTSSFFSVIASSIAIPSPIVSAIPPEIH
jgi:hypothetical protein